MKRRLNQVGLVVLILILAVFCFHSTKAEAYPFERPTLGDHLQNAILGKRCPKWKAPIDCRDRRDDDDKDRGHHRDDHHHGGEDGHDRFAVDILRSLYPNNRSGWEREGKVTCTFYEALYRIRHGGKMHPVPPGLEKYHGCDRWKRDFDYHQFSEERPGLGRLQTYLRGIDIIIGGIA
jgi:hypothetical protein